jgi:hypothetical protein
MFTFHAKSAVLTQQLNFYGKLVSTEKRGREFDALKK